MLFRSDQILKSIRFDCDNCGAYKEELDRLKKKSGGKWKKTKKYITEVVTYGVNQAKWKAAEEFCEKRGWKFKVLTEKDLFKK